MGIYSKQNRRRVSCFITNLLQFIISFSVTNGPVVQIPVSWCVNKYSQSGPSFALSSVRLAADIKSIRNKLLL